MRYKSCCVYVFTWFCLLCLPIFVTLFAPLILISASYSYFCLLSCPAIFLFLVPHLLLLFSTSSAKQPFFLSFLIFCYSFLPLILPSNLSFSASFLFYHPLSSLILVLKSSFLCLLFPCSVLTLLSCPLLPSTLLHNSYLLYLLYLPPSALTKSTSIVHFVPSPSRTYLTFTTTSRTINPSSPLPSPPSPHDSLGLRRRVLVLLALSELDGRPTGDGGHEEVEQEVITVPSGGDGAQQTRVCLLGVHVLPVAVVDGSTGQH